MPSADPVLPAARPPVPRAQIAYLGDQVAMHFIPELGKYDFHRIVDDHPSHGTKCPALAVTALYSGTIPYRFHTLSPFKGRSVLLHNPQNGDYAISECQGFSLETSGQAAPCVTVIQSRSAALVRVSKVVTLGEVTMTLDDKGAVRMYGNAQELDASEEGYRRDVFVDLNSTTLLPEIRANAVFSLAKQYVFEHNQHTGDYRVWIVDTAK